MNTEHPQKGILFICAAVFLFASSDALSKYLTNFYPVVMVLWVRYIVHISLMLAVLRPPSLKTLIVTQNPKLQIIRGLCMVNTNLMFISALHYIPLAEGTAIVYLSPLIVTALSGPLLGERIARLQWIAVAIGFIGVLFIVRPGGSMFHPVALLALGAALSFSVYQIITRKLNHTDSSSTTNFISGLISALITSMLLPFFWKTPTLHFALLMVLLGISALVSHLWMTKAYQHAKPSTLAPFSYTQLLFAGLIGYVFFNQIPDLIGLVGMLIIVAGGLLVFSKVSYRK
ncbi:DMT family transporter [Methylotenera sp.]|uniref:DMT family transporter n=1 Tax=Methylotenera sp. TaxID=2051956 RepID=UPI0024889794|nr:DMT family transporter [Methylotenera sp.]MDI1360780.1 DMT family transporter [Methylotenera sp.]